MKRCDYQFQCYFSNSMNFKIFILILIVCCMFFGGPGNEQQWEDQQEQGAQQKEETKQVNTTEYYELLEITKDATTEQIKKAFRKRALKEHPDKGGDPHKFKRLKEAYDTLLDPEKRQLYDEYGEEGVKNGGPPQRGGNSFFNFFNQQDKGPKKAKPKLVKIDVTLQQVFAGKMKEVKITRVRVCTDCEGKGGANAKPCPDCKGKGIVLKMAQVGPGMYTQVQTSCQKCRQMGVIMQEEDRCKGCEGKRVKETEKTLEVAIQQGVPDSHDYIFYGESDEYPGVMAGDVYVRINLLAHEVFERRGADLIHHKEITLLEALTGVTTTIHHLDGKDYLIATAPGEILENKELKTVRKLGMPFYKDPMSYGNLHLEFKVVFPHSNFLSAANAKLLRQAFQYRTANPEDLEQYENSAPLVDFSQELLNPKASGQAQQQEQEGGEGPQIGCQQQ